MMVVSSYSEKLKDPRWQRLRLKILQRDKFCCQICFNTKASLQIHHKDYFPNTDPWDYPEELLVTLCEDCHKTEIINMKMAETKLLRILKRRLLSRSIEELAEYIERLQDIQQPELISVIYNLQQHITGSLFCINGHTKLETKDIIITKNQTKYIFLKLDKLRGYKSSKRQSEASSIKRMLNRGYTSEQIIEIWEQMKADKFWQDKELFMMSVEGQIGAKVFHNKKSSETLKVEFNYRPITVSDNQVVQLLNELDKIRGYIYPKRLDEAHAIKRMLNKSFTTDQIIKFYKMLKDQEPWQGKELFMTIVERQMTL